MQYFLSFGCGSDESMTRDRELDVTFLNLTDSGWSLPVQKVSGDGEETATETAIPVTEGSQLTEIAVRLLNQKNHSNVEIRVSKIHEKIRIAGLKAAEWQANVKRSDCFSASESEDAERIVHRMDARN